MIDLQEPQKIQYSESQKDSIKEDFILILHTLLCLYLSIHNLLIPLVTNLLKSQQVLTDVHYWFLFQLPIQWWLRKKITPPEGYVQFLVLGSVLRLVTEVYVGQDLKSWSMVSVLVSEISSGIFYVVYLLDRPIKKLAVASFLALILVPILSYSEIRTPKAYISKLAVETHNRPDQNVGCDGSRVSLRFPLKQMNKLSNTLPILNCGFKQNLIYADSSFNLHNTRKVALNLRIYKLGILHGRVKWKFLRLVHVGPNTNWDLTPFIKNDEAYLVKAPEQRKLGHLIIVPNKVSNFPLGMGELKMSYDYLEWVSNE